MVNKKLADKVFQIVKNAVLNIDRCKIYNTGVESTVDKTTVVVDFEANRCGDKFFQPRPYEEDDDFPIFIGRQKILKTLKQYLGKNCTIDAWDHEKGLFTVQVIVKHVKTFNLTKES